MSPQSHEVSQLVGRFPSPGNVRLIRIRKRNGLNLAETNALGVSVTVIALHRYSFLHIKEWMTKRASKDAGPASDAPFFIDRHSVMICGFPVTGFGRAYLRAIGLFTMVAGHRKIYPHILPFDNFDAGTAWIACACMKHRANHLTLPATRTSLMIHDQYLLKH
jgi:hypothetical protein